MAAICLNSLRLTCYSHAQQNLSQMVQLYDVFAALRFKFHSGGSSLSLQMTNYLIAQVYFLLSLYHLYPQQ